MSRTQSKHEYFHKGVDTQHRPDIVVDLRRPPVDKMAKWSRDERASLDDFIATCQRAFAAFINELTQQTNDTPTH